MNTDVNSLSSPPLWTSLVKSGNEAGNRAAWKSMLFVIWLINLPICIGVFLYFAYGRYDEEGNDLRG